MMTIQFSFRRRSRNQISWFEAFDAHQQAHFVADRGGGSGFGKRPIGAAATLGKRALDTIKTNRDLPVQLVSELANLGDRLHEVASAGRDEQRTMLQAPLNGYARSDPKFLDDLQLFVGSLSTIEDEEAEAEEADGDEDDVTTLGTTIRNPQVVRNMFVRAMRSRAIAQASGRTPAAASRAGRLLGWLRERGQELPDHRKLGAALLVQRSARRLARASNAYLSGIPLRYRRFRRAMREENKWYSAGRFAVSDADPAEVDLTLLAMLRTARNMEANATLMRRLADRAPPLLDAIKRMRRNQVLTDEATDFSPVQLACMRALASRATDSFFASGDFNQRLTRWGSRSEKELKWAIQER